MSMLQSFRRAGRLVAAVALAAGALVTMALPASASADAGKAVERVADDVEPFALAPPCFHTHERSDFWGRYTDVQSHCSGTYRVKVIIAFGFDSSCQYMVPGERFTHSYGHAGRFDRLDLC